MNINLDELFNACDIRGTGYLEHDDFRTLCRTMSLGETDFSEVFEELDRDGDGKISRSDFIQGFSSVQALLQAAQSRRRLSLSGTAAADAATAADDFVNSQLGHDFQLLSDKCQEHVCELYQLLHNSDLQLVALYENIILAVLKDLKGFQNESQRVETSYKREKELHAAHMRQLEEEMEIQVQRVEARVRAEERAHAEAARDELRKQLECEIQDLSNNLKRLQNLNCSEQTQSVGNSLKSRVDELSQENRQLRSQLTDAQTNLTLTRSELTTLKQHYEEKSHDLEGERETLLEYIREQDNLTRQIHLLLDANKKLNDTNDDLRAELENTRSSNKRPYLRNRARMRNAEILREYFLQSSPISTISRNSSLADEFCMTGVDPYRHHLLPAQESCEEDSIHEDIDSGRSTMRGELREPDSEYEPTSLAEEDSVSCSSRKRQRRTADDSMSEAMDSGEEMELGADEDDVDGYSLHVPRPASIASDHSSRRGRRNIIPQVTGQPERMYKVVLAGDAAVGKSSFIMRLCKNKFISNLHSTLGVDFQTKVIEVDGRIIALQLWDTAGQERFRSIAKSYFRRADGVMLLYDTTYERSFVNVRDWVECIEESAPRKIPIMLCGNKKDLREEIESRGDGRTVVKTEDGQKLAKQFEALFIEASAKDGSNIYEACIELARMLRTNEDLEVQTVGMTLNELSTENKIKKACC